MARSRRPAVQQYHDRVAPTYDDSYADSYWLWHDALTWEYLKPFLPTDLRGGVLDLGCGTGKWAAKLAKSGYSVTCVDISARMLDQARRKLAGHRGTDRCTFVQTDLSDLSDLAGQTFSIALALGDPIGCTASPPVTLKRIRRVLRRDGVLVATFDNALAAVDYYLERGDAAALSRFLRDGKSHWLTARKEEQFPIFHYSPSALIRLMTTAGFEVLDVVGKTVLPMRRHRDLLESPSQRRTWAKIERKLCRRPDAIGRASHLQVACRVAGR